MAWAILVPREGTEFRIARRAAKFVDHLEDTRVTLRCGNEPAMEALAREMHKLAKKEARLCQKDTSERASPMESSNTRWVSWLVRPEH